MTVTTDRIIATLHVFERGATTKQLAAVLGMKQQSLCARLSRAFMYGQIGRERVPRVGSNPKIEWLWRAKAVPISEISARRAA